MASDTGNSTKMSDSVELKRGNASATIKLYGATLVSWKVNNDEILFVSKDAVLDNTKAIRGGVPFVFPHFGPWELGPQHGFARTSLWSVVREPEELENGDVEVILTLADSEASRNIWNFNFKILYTITLAENELISDIRVKNEGDKTFSFTLLLHTYFNVPDVTKCLVTGLSNCIYQDKTRNGDSFTESRFDVSVSEFTDRIYQNTGNEHLVTNCINGHSVKIIKDNFPDTVLWNPWKENAAKMADFGDNEFHNMLCVESGCVAEPIILAPKEIFQGAQMLQLVNGL